MIQFLYSICTHIGSLKMKWVFFSSFVSIKKVAILITANQILSTLIIIFIFIWYSNSIIFQSCTGWCYCKIDIIQLYILIIIETTYLINFTWENFFRTVYEWINFKFWNHKVNLVSLHKFTSKESLLIFHSVLVILFVNSYLEICTNVYV